MAFYNRGVAYSGKGEYDRAMHGLLAQAIHFNPDHVSSLVARSVSYLKQSEYDRVIEDLDQVIRLKPDSELAFNNRCWARAVLNKELDRALSDCNEVLHI